jgi:hypothetical protein
MHEHTSRQTSQPTVFLVAPWQAVQHCQAHVAGNVATSLHTDYVQTTVHVAA